MCNSKIMMVAIIGIYLSSTGYSKTNTRSIDDICTSNGYVLDRDVELHEESIGPIQTETLCVTQVNENGFGDITNQYSFAMQPFKDALYVSTLNAVNGMPGVPLFFLGLPFKTNGGQIYKGIINEDSTWTWNQVVTAGNGDKFNYGVRKFAVVGDYLYGVTGNHISGFEVWRTIDGVTWEVMVPDGFGDPANTSGRGLAVYNGYLYVGVENRLSAAKIWRIPIIANGSLDGDWEEVVNDGLGFIGNFWFSDFVEYNGWLYVGTLNVAGHQLWRTMNGTYWENIYIEGNQEHGGHRFEIAAMKLYVYNDKLYIGTMNFIDGAGLYVNVDDEGTVFEPIFIGGNGNVDNSYVWYLQEHCGRLYVGSFDGNPFIFDFGEFDLFSAVNPGEDEWITETTTGFGNDGHYGIRSMAVYADKLIMGTGTTTTELATKVFQAECGLCPTTRTSSSHSADDDSSSDSSDDDSSSDSSEDDSSSHYALNNEKEGEDDGRLNGMRNAEDSTRSTMIIIAVIISSIVLLVIVVCFVCISVAKKNKKIAKNSDNENKNNFSKINTMENMEDGDNKDCDVENV